MRTETQPAEIIDRLDAAGIWQLVQDIAAAHHVAAYEIVGRRRTKTTSIARRHCWAVVRWTYHFSYPEIGRLFGVDHTSVLEGVRKYEAECEGAA